MVLRVIDSSLVAHIICNSYTMGCLPVRRENPRALASGLSYVQVDKHGITILYHIHQSRPCNHEIFRAKVGKGGINIVLLVLAQLFLYPAILVN